MADKKDDLKGAMIAPWKLTAIAFVAVMVIAKFIMHLAEPLPTPEKITLSSWVKPDKWTMMTFDPYRESFKIKYTDSRFTYLVVVNGDFSNPSTNSYHYSENFGNGVTNLHISHAPGSPRMDSSVQVIRYPKGKRVAHR